MPAPPGYGEVYPAIAELCTYPSLIALSASVVWYLIHKINKEKLIKDKTE